MRVRERFRERQVIPLTHAARRRFLPARGAMAMFEHLLCDAAQTMPTTTRWTPQVRRALVLAALCAVGALTACLGELASPGGATGEAAIDLHGLRLMHQTAGDTSREVWSAKMAVYLVAGGGRREVASHLFTARDMDVLDTSSTPAFRMSFPYSSVDDKFEVEGRGISAFGDTLYNVGPASFTMRNATAQGSDVVVTVEVPPVYVGPGKTAVKLVISPRTVTTAPGTSAVLTPTLYDATGKALTSPTFRFSWWSRDPSVAWFKDGRIGVVTGGDRPGSTWLYGVFDPMAIRDSVLVTNVVLPGQIKLTNGANQSAAAGTTLPNPIAVQVLSSNGIPIPGVTVNFAVTSGGGSVSAATRVTSATEGSASVSWTLGTAATTQQLTVSVIGIPSLVVTATAIQATPSSANSSISVLPTAIKSGGDQATVKVVLRNASGAVMPNVAVTFSGPSQASFTATSATTDVNGVASTRVSSSKAGAMQINVIVSGQVIGSVILDVGTPAGVPATISIVSGDGQTVKIGQNFPQVLVVVVKDAQGYPVAGALVDWGTSVGDSRKITEANGQSSAYYVLLVTSTAGSGTITVVLTGYTSSAVFKYTAVP